MLQTLIECRRESTQLRGEACVYRDAFRTVFENNSCIHRVSAERIGSSGGGTQHVAHPPLLSVVT